MSLIIDPTKKKPTTLITDLKMPEKDLAIEVLAAKTPSFREWRVGGSKAKDVAMVPDRGFVRQLKTLDPEYEVMWDWGANKWEIWRFPREAGKEPCHILTVQTQKKTYRELGADILLKLQETRWDRFSVKELADYFDELDNQIRRRKAKEFKEKISYMAWNSFANVHCKILQVPKTYKIGRVVGDA